MAHTFRAIRPFSDMRLRDDHHAFHEDAKPGDPTGQFGTRSFHSSKKFRTRTNLFGLLLLALVTPRHEEPLIVLRNYRFRRQSRTVRSSPPDNSERLLGAKARERTMRP